MTTNQQGPLQQQGLAALAVPTVGTPITRQHFQSQCARIDFRERRFVDVNGKDAEFVNCNFSYCQFERAYFRNAKFKQCKFVGARFAFSNLRRAQFLQCDLRYVEFTDSQLDVPTLVANLPLEPNLRSEVLRSLRANAASVGDYHHHSILVLEEIAATRDHWRRAYKRSESYYQQPKYSTLRARAKAAVYIAGYKLDGFLWGHGERPLRILLSAAVLLAGLTVANLLSTMARLGWPNSPEGFVRLVLGTFCYVFDLFLDAHPASGFVGFRFVDYVIIFARYLYFGLFVSVLFRRMSHR